jgi:hypothetical protein
VFFYYLEVEIKNSYETTDESKRCLSCIVLGSGAHGTVFMYEGSKTAIKRPKNGCDSSLSKNEILILLHLKKLKNENIIEILHFDEVRIFIKLKTVVLPLHSSKRIVTNYCFSLKNYISFTMPMCDASLGN